MDLCYGPIICSSPGISLDLWRHFCCVLLPDSDVTPYQLQVRCKLFSYSPSLLCSAFIQTAMTRRPAVVTLNLKKWSHILENVFIVFLTTI